MTPDDISDLLRRSAPGREPPQLPDLTAAAARAGLLDVAYVTEDSPVGPLLLAATDRGLVRIAYLSGSGQDESSVLDALSERISPRVLAAPARLDEPRRELEDYFAGRRRAFDVTLDRRLMHGFGRRVLDATARIPYGETSTYRDVAGIAGSPRGYRAAGNALHHNPLPIVVPCHRVLPTGGGMGGYAGGADRKQTLLELESGSVDFGVNAG